MSLNALLKKTEHYDKDERYMATSDLCTALQRHAAAIGSGSVGGGGPGGAPPGGPGPTTHYSHHQAAAHAASTAMAVPIDASMERRICTAILALLDDDSNDVQAIAVKTLGVLLTTVHEEQVLEICDRLVGLVLDASKTDLRDVYTIGLRTLVKTVPPSMGNGVSARLVPRLVGGIRSDAVVDVKLAALDVLTDLLARFGSSSPSVANEHERILNVLLGQLSSPSAVVKKRAGAAIGCLAVVVGDGLLHRLVDTLLAQINLYDGRKKRKAAGGDAPPARSTRSSTSAANGAVADEEAAAADTRALIRTMCTISGTVGHRLANQIDRIVPIFLRFCDPADAVTGDDRSCDDESMEDGDDGGDSSGREGGGDGGDGDEAATALANELRESCFAGFESFVLRCPVEIQPHIPKIIEAALAYMRYDPNYSYGDEEEDGEGGGSDIDDDDEFDDDEDEGFSDDDLEDVSDDDDDSWKVRRSAIRALAAIVDAMKADPSKLWTEYGVAAALVKRFKEREENCRVDVIDCFTRLLAITVASPAAGRELQSQSATTSTGGDAMDISPSSMSMDIGDDEESVVSKFIPAIVSACEKQLKAKRGGERTKSSALALLSTACLAPGGIGGADQIGKVFGHVGAILKEPGGSKSLKLDALSLVRIVLSCDRHDPADVRACLALLLPDLCHAVQEDWYKVIAEALRVLSEVPRIATASGGDDPMLSPSAVGAQLFDAIQPRLAAHDLDQEIKECSLSATAALLSMHMHLTQSQREVLLTLILERLRNEITRLAALKTLSAVAAAGGGPGDAAGTTPIDLSCILGDAVAELASLLRQQSRGLKQSSLETLRVLVTGHGEGMDIALCEQVLRESGSIISDSDLHISHLSLRVSISVLKACPSSASLVQTHILPPALVLSTSPLLQDLALDSLLLLLEEVVVSNVVPFPELHADLKGRLPTGNDGVISKPSISNLAKCLAVTTCATTKGNRDTVVKDLVANLNSPDIDDVHLQLSLLTSGEIGQRTDLNEIDGVVSELQKVYLHSFESSNEETKAAAAYALGRAAVGSMSAFLPAILDALENSTQKKQYLLLSAIKEIIKCHQMSGRDLTLSLPVVLPHLVSHFAAKEEGVRTMVAECMGSLCCLKPREILPKLQELTAAHCGKGGGGAGEDEDDVSEDALVCWTVATAVKFAISHRAPSSELLPFMPSFLVLLNEQDLSVRLAALLMVYASVHHTPQLLSGLMREHVLPALYELAQLNLKRVVDLGPFKHTVDDALPLRKASLSIFATSLENCPASLDIPAFMPILAKALEDVEDVQLQAHHIVISMCLRHPEPILAAADTFVDPLEKTINKKKGNKTGTELERANEWIKSGLRVMLALSHVEGAMSSRKFADFVDRTKKNAKFQPFLEMLEEER